MENASPRRRRRAQGHPRRHARSTAASGRRRRSKRGAIAPRERLDQIAAHAAHRRGGGRARPAPPASWCRAGWCSSNGNRNVGSEAAFAAALSAPGLDADLECRARFHRAQSAWKQRQRTRAAPLFDEAESACARAANRDLHAKALYQGARCYANAGNRDAALAHYARVEAEHADHSYADDARLRSAELATDAGDDATAAKLLAEVPDPLPEGRPAQRGAVAAGVLGLARRTRLTRRCAGWTRTCASSRARRSGTRRDGSSTGRGACSRSAARPTRRAPGTSAPCASTRCRSTRCCR